MLHRPGETPHIETALEPGELITAVALPKPVGGKQVYHKVRDRASYAFALVSVAVIVHPRWHGPRRARWRRAKPWRDAAADAELPQGAKAVDGQTARRREADERKRFQDSARRTDARCHPCRSEGRAMKFDAPATTNPIDQLKVVGQPHDRIDGPLKTTGTAPYAYERHDVAPNGLWLLVGAAIAKGRIAFDRRAARASRARRSRHRDGRECRQARQGQDQYGAAARRAEIQHYHQAVALVVAETFEQARAAAALVESSMTREHGSFDLANAKDSAMMPKTINPESTGRRLRRRPSPLRRCSSTRPTPRPIRRTP